MAEETRLSFFADLQNLYDRKNARGFDVKSSDFRITPDGQLVIVSNEEEWLGMTSSFGAAGSSERRKASFLIPQRGCIQQPRVASSLPWAVNSTAQTL